MAAIKQVLSGSNNREWLKWAVAVTASLGAILEVIDTRLIKYSANVHFVTIASL